MTKKCSKCNYGDGSAKRLGSSEKKEGRDFVRLIAFCFGLCAIGFIALLMLIELGVF